MINLNEKVNQSVAVMVQTAVRHYSIDRRFANSDKRKLSQMRLAARLWSNTQPAIDFSNQLQRQTILAFMDIYTLGALDGGEETK